MINLHAHSEYSSLDGFSQIDKIVERVKQLGQSAIALTDHGNLNGAYKFYNACKKADIKPILGNEMYICPEYTDVKPNHITLLAYNNEGWRNLLKLHKISYLHKYYKPRINIKDLEIHSAGLIVLSGCPSGLMSKNIRDNKLQEAIEWMQTLKRIFKDNFYIEIMEHGIPFQKDLNKTLRELSRKYNIPKVFTVDCHYLKREDATFQDYLLCDQLKTNIYDTTRTLKHEVSEFYIKTAEETSAEPDEIMNTIKIADQCNVEIKSQKWLLSQIENSTEIFAQLINEGIEKRGIPRNDIYMSRLREEYKTIIEANLVGYLLTVYDYIHYAKENDILVGPGRGSVGGCLTAYLIGIHDVDPIKHNLLFSRFYNAGRSASLPDIDIDFPEKHVDTIRQYVKNKYGQEKVAHIGTNTYLQPKGAVKLICRVLGIDFKQSNLYSATIEDTAATEALAQSDSVFADIMTKAKNFENLAVYNSIHAAGIIISPIDLETIVPLRVNEDNGLYVTGWDMEDIEGIGLVKFDFLSLGTLDVISDALKLANIKLEDIPTDNQETFDLISKTRNVGIFQLSSEGISKVANEMKVQSIDDIAVVVALYRPGPMASDLHNIYISRKMGTSPIYYDHPLLESVLKETYGLIVFQEQVTQIAMVLAKITEKEADNLRKAIGKKIPELMKEQKELFINGCKTNNIDISVADKLWKEMEVFASYAFNRCIDGDCYINRDNYTHGRRYTIAEMYDLKNNPRKYKKTSQESISKKYRRCGYGKAKNLIQERIFTDDIKDIIYQGTRLVYKITLENGKTINVTKNHKFPTSNGIKVVQDLISNSDFLFCLGQYELNKTLYNTSKNGAPQYRGYGKSYNQEGFPEGKENPGYVDGNYAELQKRIQELSNVKQCQICNKEHKRLEHHHINKLRYNNSPQNIMKLCPSCHKKEDYKIGRKKKFSKGILSELSKIVSIECIGEKPVYDIEMNNEPHNLLVNDIATCNSHATEYAYITYYTAYLKAHYPVQFMAAILNNSYNKPDKLSTYLLECQKMGIKVIPPSLVRGNYDFRVDQDEIVYGLKGVKGISEKTAQEIYQQKYESFSDFVYKYKPSKDLIIFLAESGALDEFGYKRNQIIQSAGSIIEQIKRDRKDSKTKSLFGKLKEIYIPVVEESAEVDLATKEYERLGTYLVYNPLRGVTLSTPDLLEGEIFIEGFITKIETRITKKKNTIAIISFMTHLGPIEALLLPQLFLEQKDNIKQNSYVSISGNYEDKLIVHKIWKKEVVNDSNNSRMDYF